VLTRASFIPTVFLLDIRLLENAKALQNIIPSPEKNPRLSLRGANTFLIVNGPVMIIAKPLYSVKDDAIELDLPHFI